MKSDTFGDYLKRIRSKVRTRVEMSAVSGLHVNTIKGYEQEGRLPDIDYLACLAMETGHSLAELINMRLSSSRQGEAFLKCNLVVADKAACGNDSNGSNTDFFKIKRFEKDGFITLDRSLVPKGVACEDLTLFCVPSDSIERAKRYVLILTKDSSIIDGATYLVDYGHGPVIKMVQVGIDNSLILADDNKALSPLVVTHGQRHSVSILGKAICRIDYC